MPRPAGRTPTDTELQILRVLWTRGPCTVRQVHEALSDRDTGYTTMLKLMQIMAAKGLVDRDESRRTHVYTARLRQRQTQRRLVGELLERLFAGSSQKLVLQALKAKRLSRKELAEIRKVLDELEGKE
ncbi:MAG TPA: BlaI/MecI/CopY family transcriptional regulator [Phycisphaerae bacterium]|nr:BlaI/MecI/CopY family transcriptional regulator [Phycisphaerae bacterium]